MATEESIFNPRDVEDLSRELRMAVLKKWAMPCINFWEGENYELECSTPTSAFVVESWGKKYRVHVTEIDS